MSGEAPKIDPSLLLSGLSNPDANKAKDTTPSNSESVKTSNDNAPVTTEVLPTESQLVHDHVSNVDVAVTSKTELRKEADTEEFKRMLKAAEDSLDGAKISEIGLSHPYWSLVNEARQFAMKKGL